MSDIQGRIVKRISHKELQKGPNNFEIRTGDLDSGVYFVSIQTPYGQYNKKVICVN